MVVKCPVGLCPTIDKPNTLPENTSMVIQNPCNSRQKFAKLIFTAHSIIQYLLFRYYHIKDHKKYQYFHINQRNSNKYFLPGASQGRGAKFLFSLLLQIRSNLNTKISVIVKKN